MFNLGKKDKIRSEGLNSLYFFWERGIASMNKENFNQILKIIITTMN